MNNLLSKVDFEDVAKLSDSHAQRVLKDVDNDVLAVALKGASPDAAKRIYDNISEDRKESVKADMERMGSVRLGDVEEAQQKIAAVIQLSKVDFEDVAKLSDSHAQRVLKDVDNDVLAVALKGASPDAAKRIYDNISEDRKESVKADMERMGSVRLGDVEEAQQKIAAVIQGLEDAGEIEI